MTELDKVFKKAWGKYYYKVKEHLDTDGYCEDCFLNYIIHDELKLVRYKESNWFAPISLVNSQSKFNLLLTKEEIDTIKIDLNHILKNVSLTNEQKELRLNIIKRL